MAKAINGNLTKNKQNDNYRFSYYDPKTKKYDNIWVKGELISQEIKVEEENNIKKGYLGVEVSLKLNEDQNIESVNTLFGNLKDKNHTASLLTNNCFKIAQVERTNEKTQQKYIDDEITISGFLNKHESENNKRMFMGFEIYATSTKGEPYTPPTLKIIEDELKKLGVYVGESGLKIKEKNGKFYVNFTKSIAYNEALEEFVGKPIKFDLGFSKKQFFQEQTYFLNSKKVEVIQAKNKEVENTTNQPKKEHPPIPF